MRTRLLSCGRGQSVVEFALVLPLMLLVVLGITETGYVLLDQHVITKLTREGSNLISRDVTLQDAGTAILNMTTRPVDLTGPDSRLIFSVLKKGSTVGSPNFDKLILYQRHVVGGLAAASALETKGIGVYGGAPNYEAANSDTNVNLQLKVVPANLVVAPGGMLYVTEVFSKHTLLTPLERFGVQLPDTLYSIAYF